jgi:TolB-like protein
VLLLRGPPRVVRAALAGRWGPVQAAAYSTDLDKTGDAKGCAGMRKDAVECVPMRFQPNGALAINTRGRTRLGRHLEVGGFPTNLRLVMDHLNVSRVGLAHELGVDKTVIGRWLAGVNRPTNHNLTRLTGCVRKRVPGFVLTHWNEPPATIVAALRVASGQPLAPAVVAAVPLPDLAVRFSDAMEGSSLAVPAKPAIAVLPFTNMSADPEQQYFVDGMVEEIITALSRNRWLLVIARTSSFIYKGQAVDVRRVGRELGVRYVLEGSVRKAGGQVRIMAQLIDAETGAHLWANRFDGALEDVFELQDTVAAHVAGAIEPALRATEIRRSSGRLTNDLTAYDLFLRARESHDSHHRSGVIEALEMLEQAITRDPCYADALSLAAQCCAALYVGGWADDADADRRGVDFARRALRVASDDPLVLARSAYVLGNLGEDIDAAIALIERSLAMNPTSALGWHHSGWLRLWAGQPDLAIEHLMTARRLNPYGERRTELAVGIGHFFAGRFDQARAMLIRSVQEYPGWVATYRFLAACYAHMGRLDEAREIVQRLRMLTPLVVPSADHWRDRQQRELYLSGLRLAASGGEGIG